MVAAWGRREREEAGGFRMEGGRRRGPRRGLKGLDLGVESGRAEVWRLGVKWPNTELLGHRALLGRLGRAPDGANSSARRPAAPRLGSWSWMTRR